MQQGTNGGAPVLQIPANLAASVPNVTILTARLARVLAEEVDLLDVMKIKEVAAIQESKGRLVTALEWQKNAIAKRPEIVRDASRAELQELQTVIGIFEQVREANYKSLLIAKRANDKVIEAIREVVTDFNLQTYYDHTGEAESDQSKPVSLALNDMI